MSTCETPLSDRARQGVSTLVLLTFGAKHCAVGLACAQQGVECVPGLYLPDTSRTSSHTFPPDPRLPVMVKSVSRYR